jgi:type IV pilus assembly protein PilE
MDLLCSLGDTPAPSPVNASPDAASERGFTLIELMVVVAIIAILLAIAIPSYRIFVLRSQVRAAQTDLQALAVNAENFLQRTLSYSGTDTANTVATRTRFPGWTPSARDFNFIYDVTVPPAPGATTYQVTATWTGNDRRLTGCVITLTNANARTMSPQCVGVMGSATW